MSVFLVLVAKLIPLYVMMFLGFVAGKYLKAQKETVATLLIYILAPIIIFHGTVTTTLTWNLMTLPLLFYALCCIFAFSFLKLASLRWSDSHKNILAFASASGNTGYFGLPVAIALFDQHIFGIMVIAILAFGFYESSVGFYITARGHHTGKEALRKVLRLPTMYAFLVGLAVNLSGIELGSTYLTMAESFRGAYTVFGMMIVGLGISGMKKLEFDWEFLSFAFIAKFVVWPAVVGSIVWLDTHIWHFYTTDMHHVMILLSIVPLPGNTVALATELRTEPEKAAFAVLLSTLIALIYIPVVAVLFL